MQNNSGTAGSGCEQPSFLCGSTPFYTSFSTSAVTYLQIGGFSKTAPFLIDDIVPLSSYGGEHPGIPCASVFFNYPREKVPIYLVNSVLNI